VGNLEQVNQKLNLLKMDNTIAKEYRDKLKEDWRKLDRAKMRAEEIAASKCPSPRHSYEFLKGEC